MEQHGLDQLIGELKSRGVKAGAEEAARLVVEAKAKAETIISQAKAEADSIRRKAEDDRTATKAALDSELKQAARVGLAAFREAIEKGFAVPEIDAQVKRALDRPGFLEDAVGELVKSFAATGLANTDIEVLLPERRKNELGAAFIDALSARGASGVKVRFDDSLSFGLRIGPKGSGFNFDLSDEGFREVLVRFLSPRFRAAFYAPTSKAGGGKP
ncbi:MAG: hypothetical protein MUC50_01010 [Myxococcota bacterium]|jgi:V/A-type H+-transporting ATPase subunit E|nr:hypothetical protein [Myxococcota bacterium]